MTPYVPSQAAEASRQARWAVRPLNLRGRLHARHSRVRRAGK